MRCPGMRRWCELMLTRLTSHEWDGSRQKFRGDVPGLPYTDGCESRRRSKGQWGVGEIGMVPVPFFHADAGYDVRCRYVHGILGGMKNTKADVLKPWIRFHYVGLSRISVPE